MKTLTLMLLAIVMAGCSSAPPAAPVQDASKAKQYQMHGKVLSVNAADKTAKIDADEIKGFMGAMAMDYPVKDPAGLKQLAAGQTIDATVFVTDDGYWIDGIKQSADGKK